LKNKLSIESIIYASVEIDIIFYSFLLISESGLSTNIVDIRKSTNNGTYLSRGVICSIRVPIIIQSLRSL